MSLISIDFTKSAGAVKPMHAVNNGPLKKSPDQTKDNYDTYKAARIPYMRNHDASFYSGYGGEHSNDIHMIFPDFDADPYDPASYDFVLTDEYMERTLSAGTKIFFRLGSKIEHEIKKYGTIPPRDFKKWAIICEHVIRHMNEGWADGHHFGIVYWEIWNEPDLNDKTWGGTPEEFFSLYEITAKHLKSCFPHLKIGGPAVCWDHGWWKKFLTHMKETNAPLDFFSWHMYASEVKPIVSLCREIREMLNQYGFPDAESILNEYNFVIDWSPRFIESIEAIISMPGAAFTASAMLACQQEPLDMLMYYDARPSSFNGMFDYYTARPLKGYYPFVMFSRLYALGKSVFVTADSEAVQCAAAAGSDGRQAIMLSYFDYNGTEAQTVTLHLTGAHAERMEMLLLDADHTMEKSFVCVENGNVTLYMEPNTVLLLQA